MQKYFLPLICAILSAGCSKEINAPQSPMVISQELVKETTGPLRASTGRYSVVSQPTAVQIFQSIDHVALQNALNTSNSSLNPFIASLASQVRSYFENVHQVNFEAEELNLTNAEMVIMGMVFAGIEMGDFNSEGSPMMSMLGDFELSSSIGGESCFYSVLGSFFAVRDIVALVQSFRSGAVGASTIIRGVKLAMGRVATVFAVGTAVYSLGDCLGWWG